MIPEDKNEEEKSPHSGGSLNYIDWNYCKKKCSERIPKSEENVSNNNEGKSAEESKFIEAYFRFDT